MRRIHLSLFAVAVLVFCLAGLASAQSSSTITPARTTVLPAAQVGPVVPGGTEISPLSLGDADAEEQESNGVGVNRTIAKTHGVGVKMKLGKHPKSNPQFNFGFEGLNLFNQRYANGGNQYYLEPPDQGLCAGNGYVLETVNTVLRMYDSSGNPLTGPIDLNSFYGYPDQYNRTTGDMARRSPIPPVITIRTRSAFITWCSRWI